MDGLLTLHGLQNFRERDFHPDNRQGYFLKLIEEIGELAEVIRKNARLADSGGIKGTIEEELYDVLYYTLALANVYDIDLAQCHRLKDEINRKKYGRQKFQSEEVSRPDLN